MTNLKNAKFYTDGTVSVDGTMLPVRISRPDKHGKRGLYLPEDHPQGYQDLGIDVTHIYYKHDQLLKVMLQQCPQ
jgi:hypothetical protein